MKLHLTSLLLALGAANAFVPQSATKASFALQSTRPDQQQQQRQASTTSGAPNQSFSSGSTNVNRNTGNRSTGNDAYTQMLQNTNPTRNRQQQYQRDGRSANNRSQSGSGLAPIEPVQGGSLKTWSLQSTAIERVQVIMRTEGRPLDADIDLWNGPDNTPQRMRVYVEDGAMRPFNAVIETPRGPNTVAIRNIGQMEFPLAAQVSPNPALDQGNAPLSGEYPRTIQGGALKTYPFDPNVESVQVMLRTDGRPLNARIELLQGPNNNKQVMEVYIEDGMTRPFYAIIETPGSGNVVRVVNTATVEFPMTASVEPFRMGNPSSVDDIIVSGDDYYGAGSSSFGSGDSFGSYNWDREGTGRGFNSRSGNNDNKPLRFW